MGSGLWHDDRETVILSFGPEGNSPNKIMKKPRLNLAKCTTSKTYIQYVKKSLDRYG